MEDSPSDYEMSFLYVILNGFTLNQKYYNCSDSTAIQWENAKHPILGWYFLVTGIIFVTLYIPCIIAVIRSDLMKTSCFKIMLCLSIFDILSLITNSIATGYFALKGQSFCDYPKTIFTLGSTGLGSWMGGCSACIMLAINRCCDLNPNLKLRWIFIGKRACIPLGAVITYGLYSIFLTKPLLFSSGYVSWFFDPKVNSNPLWYVNLPHTINNCLVSICTTSLYVYLCALLFIKSRAASSNSISKTQRQVFLQSVVMCSFHAAAAYIYVYMQYFYSPPVVMLIGHIAWQMSNGAVCIVYLTMNRTIRTGVYEMVVPRRIRYRMKMKTQTTSFRSLTIQRGISTTRNTNLF